MKVAKPETLTTVDRALSMLEILGKQGQLNLTQLAELMQAQKPTVFRLAASLIERGWIEKTDDLLYGLGPAALNFSGQANSNLSVEKILQPLLSELHTATQETVHLTRLEGRSIVYITQLLSPKAVVPITSLGSRSPAHCVSPGLALLATLSDKQIDWVLRQTFTRYTDATLVDQALIKQNIAKVRERGYAVNTGAFRKEVGGVGVAVVDQKGAPLVGLSICMPTYRLSQIDTDALGKRLVKAAKEAQRLLRLATPPD